MLNINKMKIISQKNLFILIIILVIGGFCALFPQSVEAEYRLMEKIPGQGEVTNLPEYLQALYTFGIAVVGILSVVMIAVGAFMYIVTAAGNVTKMANAKDIITNAIFGLILAVIAWLILFIINPDLVGGSVGQKTEQISSKADELLENAAHESCQKAAKTGENKKVVYETYLCRGDKICITEDCSEGQECQAAKCYYKPDNTDDLAQPGTRKSCGLLVTTDISVAVFEGDCLSEEQAKKYPDCPPSSFVVTEGRACPTVCCVTLGDNSLQSGYTDDSTL